MEKTLRIYSKPMIECKKAALEIKLNVKENPYEIPMENLFRMAARENKKRAFLFVSRLIGKHIPMDPRIMDLTGALLARKWAEDIYNQKFHDTELIVNAVAELLKYDAYDKPQSLHYDEEIVSKGLISAKRKISLNEKTLFIGFAETATGLGNSVFKVFKNAEFINTTRVQMRGREANFIFKEEHSHAVNHRMYSPSEDYFTNFEHIVLVDDEITTGNTARNLISNLPGDKFSVISILDWRGDGMKVREEVSFTSLFIGDIECIKNHEIVPNDKKAEKSSGCYKEHIIIDEVKVGGYLKSSGRFGLNEADMIELDSRCSAYGEKLKDLREGGKCLCLGDGEFMYMPCEIAKNMGDGVFYHSVTRSPVHAFDLEEYGNRNKYSFTSTDWEVVNYIYNLPKSYYDDVFFFSERYIKDEIKEEISGIFKNAEIKNIHFIEFGEGFADE